MADIVPGQPELIRYGGFILNTDFPNLLSNPNFLSWTGDDPDNWTVIEAGDGALTQVGPGNFSGGGGSGAANIKTSIGFANRATLTQAVISVQDGSYEVYVTYWENVGSGTGNVQIGTGIANELTHGSAKYSFGSMTPTGTGNYVLNQKDFNDAGDITYDDCFVRRITPWQFVQDWNTTSNISAVWLSGESATERSLLQTFGSNSAEVYQVIFNVSSLTLANTPTTYLAVSVNGGGINKIYEGGTYTFYLVSGSSPSAGVKFQTIADTAGDTFTLKSVSVKHVPSKESTDSETLIITGAQSVGGAIKYTGPNGRYTRTTTINDGKPTWSSNEDHPDGSGGTATYYVWWDTGTSSWVLGQNIGTVGGQDWDIVSSIDIPIGLSFTPNGNSAGTIIPFGGPVTANRREPRVRSRYG